MGSFLAESFPWLSSQCHLYADLLEITHSCILHVPSSVLLKSWVKLLRLAVVLCLEGALGVGIFMFCAGLSWTQYILWAQRTALRGCVNCTSWFVLVKPVGSWTVKETRMHVLHLGRFLLASPVITQGRYQDKPDNTPKQKWLSVLSSYLPNTVLWILSSVSAQVVVGLSSSPIVPGQDVEPEGCRMKQIPGGKCLKEKSFQKEMFCSIQQTYFETISKCSLLFFSDLFFTAVDPVSSFLEYCLRRVCTGL